MKERLKRIKLLIKRAEKMGLDTDKITEGKSLETLAHNKKTVANFEKRYERQKALPKIRQTIKNFEKKAKEKKEKEKEENNKKIRRGMVTDESINQLKWNENIPPKKITSKKLKERTKDTMQEYLYTFFKQIRHEYEAQKKIKKIISRFGTRLDLAYQFMEHVAEQSFKYEYDRDFMREEMPDDFRQILYDRLDEFDRILNREFKI